MYWLVNKIFFQKHRLQCWKMLIGDSITVLFSMVFLISEFGHFKNLFWDLHKSRSPWWPWEQTTFRGRLMRSIGTPVTPACLRLCWQTKTERPDKDWSYLWSELCDHPGLMSQWSNHYLSSTLLEIIPALMWFLIDNISISKEGGYGRSYRYNDMKHLQVSIFLQFLSLSGRETRQLWRHDTI